ncbi:MULTISPECIES: hypothetical protein [unclassified Streptomyces]|uniref:hypothetical protein n=1 Tax=unclassified Streptomyces TaxID=2593676 RepID=UPI002ED03909|nr:hypothetical protein OH827_31575 [Streptomyces sp. NBC_00891]WSY09297.1 hypothetical protein OG464_31580 [Streptomyces sp. NBC_00890]WSZ10919.1 hypothetical protein OG704_31585 [Streptomyces sp. NBC_00869]WSZ21577.1 hypothetical protein OG498_01985 [Streptomyces sp. NBC_00870]
MRKLMPLRVPAGWAILFNTFVEFPPHEPPTPAEIEAFRGEDILSAQRIIYTDDGWKVDMSAHVIDLGWYPGGDADGRYRLCLARDGWNDIPVQFEHRDCYVIRNAFDTLTRMLSEGKRLSLIARVLADPRFPQLPGGPPAAPA